MAVSQKQSNECVDDGRGDSPQFRPIDSPPRPSHETLAFQMMITLSALLSHLSLLFVPAGVGVMVHWGRIGHDWLPITVALVLSTLLSLGLTALFMQVLIRFTTAKG